MKAIQSFFDKIGRFGGNYKAGEVADLLGVSRQTINNQRIGHKLLSVKSGNDYVFPAFQFHDESKLKYFEVILKELVNVGSVTKCTFFMNKTDTSAGYFSPLELLKNKPDNDIICELKQKAALFGLHSAK